MIVLWAVNVFRKKRTERWNANQNSSFISLIFLFFVNLNVLTFKKCQYQMKTTRDNTMLSFQVIVFDIVYNLFICSPGWVNNVFLEGFWYIGDSEVTPIHHCFSFHGYWHLDKPLKGLRDVIHCFAVFLELLLINIYWCWFLRSFSLPYSQKNSFLFKFFFLR